MPNVLICIPVVDTRLEFAQRVLLPSLRMSLDAYPGPVEFAVSLVAQNIPPEALAKFVGLPRWHFQFIDKIAAPFQFGNRLGAYQARFLAALPDFDYYLIADDDFRFHTDSVTRYAAIVEGLEADPKVGSVMCGSFFGGGRKKADPFYPYPDQSVWTNRGLIVRNLERINPEKYSTIFPKSVKNVMNWQRAVFSPDNIVGCLPLVEGLSVAKSYNHRTQHYNCPCGGTANLPKDYQPLLAEKRGVLYPTFRITEDWKDADDWGIGYQLFGENLIFNREIVGSRDGKPATADCLEYSEVFTPSQRFSRAAKPVKAKVAKVKAPKVRTPKPGKKSKMFFDD